MPLTKEEIQAKAEATRLKNLRHNAERRTLTALEKRILGRLEEKEREGLIPRTAAPALDEERKQPIYSEGRKSHWPEVVAVRTPGCSESSS